MIFKVSDKLPKKIHEAAAIAEQFLAEVNINAINSLEPFTYYDGTAEGIFSKIFFINSPQSNAPLKPPYPVLPWYPGWRWTRAIATTFGDGAIHINMYKITDYVDEVVGFENVWARAWYGKKYLKRVPIYGTVDTVHGYVNTLVHETMHNLGFSHGDNYVTEEKLRSVPFAVGGLAEQYSRNRVRA